MTVLHKLTARLGIEHLQALGFLSKSQMGIYHKQSKAEQDKSIKILHYNTLLLKNLEGSFEVD